jgi:anti-sigma B factor antagonist
MFSVRLSTRDLPGHVTVELRGELDLLDAADVAASLAAASSREPLVIVDLSGLRFIDASGVAALARGRDYARGGGGELLLTAPQAQVRKMLAIIFQAGDLALAGNPPDPTAAPRTPAQVADVPVPRPRGATARRCPCACPDTARCVTLLLATYSHLG